MEENIIEKEKYGEVFNNYFKNFKPSLKKDLFNVKVRFLGYGDSKAKFKVEDTSVNLDNLKKFSVYVEDKNDNIINAYFELKEKMENKTIELEPVKITISKIVRSGERIDMLSSELQPLKVYVSNIMSDFLLEGYLKDRQRMLDKIKNIISMKIDHIFDSVNISFFYEKGSFRMDYFTGNISPIFIEDINNNDISEQMEDIFQECKKEIVSGGFVSEISVPIVYKMKLVYGFIKIHSKKPFSAVEFKMVKKLAIITDNLIRKHHLIPDYDDRIIVSDISKKGVGLVFKEKKFIKFFKENSIVYFDMFLPSKPKVNFALITRSITFEENSIRIGCQIKDLDALSEVYYEEFIDSLKTS